MRRYILVLLWLRGTFFFVPALPIRFKTSPLSWAVASGNGNKELYRKRGSTAQGRHTNPSSSLFFTCKTISENWSHATYLKLTISSHFICHQVKACHRLFFFLMLYGTKGLIIPTYKYIVNMSLFIAQHYIFFIMANKYEICIISVEGNKWFWLWFDCTIALKSPQCQTEAEKLSSSP